MARLWSSGFELQSTTNGVEFDTGTGTGTKSIDTTTKRSGAASLRVNSSANYWFMTHQYRTSATSKVYARMYLYIASLPDGPMTILGLTATSGGNSIGQIQLNTNGTLELSYYNGGYVQVGSDSSALSTGQWYRIELSADDADANNTISARIDGTEFASGNGNNLGGHGMIQIGSVYASQTFDLYFDDIAVNDGSGSYQTSWPGDGKILHLKPNAAGDNNTWLTSAGGAGSSTNYQAVDELTPDDATTYLKRTTSTIKVDDYNCEASGIGASDTVNLVSVGVRGKATSNAANAGRNILLRIKKTTSGTVQKSGSIDYSTTAWETNGDPTPKVYRLTTYVDPDAGAWTQGTLDSMQIGMENETSATIETDISTIWALVDYTVNSGVTISVSDIISLQESLEGGGSVSLLVFEVVTIAEDVSVATSGVVVDLDISVFDQITITENLQSAGTLGNISVFDQITIVENVQSAGTLGNISVFDQVTIVENTVVVVSSASGLSASVSDQVTIAENVQSAGTLGNILVFDQVTIVENIQRAGALGNISIFDQVTIAENLQRTGTLGTISVFDQVVITENVGKVVTLNVGVSDQVTITESVQRAGTLGSVFVSDQITIAENLQGAGTLGGISVFDQVTIAENTGLTRGFGEVNSYDQVSISESISLSTTIAPISVFDQVTITENVQRSGTLGTISVFDQVIVTENIQRVLVFFASVSDQITIAENLQSAGTLGNISVFDQITIAENVQSAGTLGNISVFDQVTIVENTVVVVSSASGLSASVSDQVTIAENVQSAGTLGNILVFDQVSVSESISAVIQNLVASVSDTVTISEFSLVVSGATPLFFSDTVSIVEAVTVTNTNLGGISVVDQVAISEHLSVATVFLVNVSDTVGVEAVLVAFPDTIYVIENVVVFVEDAGVTLGVVVNDVIWIDDFVDPITFFPCAVDFISIGEDVAITLISLANVADLLNVYGFLTVAGHTLFLDTFEIQPIEEYVGLFILDLPIIVEEEVTLFDGAGAAAFITAMVVDSVGYADYSNTVLVHLIFEWDDVYILDWYIDTSFNLITYSVIDPIRISEKVTIYTRSPSFENITPPEYRGRGTREKAHGRVFGGDLGKFHGVGSSVEVTRVGGTGVSW